MELLGTVFSIGELGLSPVAVGFLAVVGVLTLVLVFKKNR